MTAPNAGGSVFVVEDEVMIRLMVTDMLGQLGYDIAAEAGDLQQALKLAHTAKFDFALLDVNLKGHVITPVADAIKMRNRPFIFTTGYGCSGLPQEFRQYPALQKPFQVEMLADKIDEMRKSAAA